MIREVAEAEVDRLEARASASSMRERMRALTFEVIVRAVFGVTERERIERLRRALVAVIDMQMIFAAAAAPCAATSAASARGASSSGA